MLDFSLIIPLFFAIISILLSRHFSHKLEKIFFMAYLRVTLQLIFLAIFLQWIFTHQSSFLNIIILSIMIINAAYVTHGRIREKYSQKFLQQLVSLIFVLWPMSLLGSITIYGKDFFIAQFYIPFFGLLLGNSLNTLSTGLDFYTTELRKNRNTILSLMGIGASLEEATQEIFSRSLRLGLNGNLNAMISMGIVSVPGVMTGQMLAGTSPLQAALVQIITMFFVLCG